MQSPNGYCVILENRVGFLTSDFGSVARASEVEESVKALIQSGEMNEAPTTSRADMNPARMLAARQRIA
jgi:hypothetical protein